jgi:hypothetical protein
MSFVNCSALFTSSQSEPTCLTFESHYLSTNLDQGLRRLRRLLLLTLNFQMKNTCKVVFLYQWFHSYGFLNELMTRLANKWKSDKALSFQLQRFIDLIYEIYCLIMIFISFFRGWNYTYESSTWIVSFQLLYV